MSQGKSTDRPVVGVIGVGMVGWAVVDCFSQHFATLAYDPKTGLIQHGMGPPFPVAAADPYRVLASDCDVLFLCVPTPMHMDGRQDLSILESVVAALGEWGPKGLVVIKSTVAPGTTDRLQDRYPEIPFVFNPEFLREKTAAEDFRTQDRVVIGAVGAVAPLKALYAASHPGAVVYQTNPATAELVKYTANCFLATKVSFANEIAQLCEALGIDYDELVRLLKTDPRIGTSHLQVPGPDGHRGFGMTCFPKDLNALIQCAHTHGVKPTLLEAAWQKNLEVRPERDWERLEGRAVSRPSSGSAGV